MSRLDEWKQQAQDESAPEGLRQASAAGVGVATGDPRYEGSKLGQWMQDAQDDPSQLAGRWFSGANASGTNNGWNTDFTNRFMAGQEAAAKSGNLNRYFEQPDATGVVTWDHKGAEGQDFKFGDIYDGGKYEGNVFELYDKQTANLRMLPWLFDGKQQARMFSDSDRVTRINREVEGARQENNERIPKALSALDFQADTKETQASLDKGPWSEITEVAAGIGSGAYLGSGFGPWGALIGGVVGGVGAFLNQDELEEKAARSVEIVKQNAEDNNEFSAFFTAVGQAGDLALAVGSPVQNLVKGASDAALEGETALGADGKLRKLGGVGDDEAGFYAVGKDGQRLAGYGTQALALGGAVVDGVLQFGSPGARRLYSAAIGAHLAGASGELLTNGFEAFNPRSGEYDPLFQDEDGSFSPVRGAAGILNIGLDAVQLGGLRGIAGATGRTNAAIAAGRQVDEAAGFRFILDESGRAVEKKATLALLAPSEQVSAANAARAARVRAMNRGEAVTADDFYQASMQLANGSNRIKAAVVNGFGEGYEELVQSILEPISMSGDLSFGEIANSFLYGAAGGVGMSAGAYRGQAGQDARLFNQAQIVQQMKFGTELTKDEWDKLDPTDKRARAAMNQVEQGVTRDALKQIRREQAAERVASEPDMAKAMDARRSVAEKELRRGTDRTDSYTVISGILDQGELTELGNRLGDTLRSEAIQGSAVKVLQLLEDRAKGIGLQKAFLENLLEDLKTKDQADPAVVDALAKNTQLLETVNNATIVSASIVEDVRAMVQYIYNDSTTEAQAQDGIRELNKVLGQWFDKSFVFEKAQLDGWGLRAAAAKDAAVRVVSLLHSREPKLDAGSYHSLLPQASWELTRTKSDNFLQVNMDYLQAINGDFDGDKLRAENQLILDDERFTQSRAGSNFAGVGQVLDVAVRNFDEALTEALGRSLIVTDNNTLRDAAEATMANIETAITYRYGTLMSPAVLNDVLSRFAVSVKAGKKDARVELLNDLAKAAGNAINDLGRRDLNNEWLWISKVVRANFQQFQRSYWKLNKAQSLGPTPTEAVSDTGTPEGTQILKSEAVNDAQTLALFVPGNSLFRKFQSIHYTFFNSSVLGATGTENMSLEAMAETYAELSRNVTQSELMRVKANNSVAARAMAMLDRLVQDAMRDPELRRRFDPSTAAAVLANVKVKNVWWDAGEAVTDGKSISLAQLLLKRALEAEREEAANVFANDEQMQARHARIDAMTRASEKGQVNAELAFLELFRSVPFGDALGNVTGNFAVQTTPDQWLQTYISQDEEGRRELRRFYRSHPANLKRKGKSNLPYSMSEMESRDITPYRSMLDALTAVGNASITFDPMATDPADALNGVLVQPSKAAQKDFVEAFNLLLDSLREYRKLSSKKRAKRPTNADLMQELLQTYPEQGRQLLELIPDAAANALFEYRDNTLYVSNWLYDMFSIEDPQEALMFYWRNLTLAQWNATQISLNEDDGAGVSGRKYDKLQSRFQRLMYELAMEPGQANLELLIRKMTSSTNLDEFFVWVNSAPGIRSNRIVGDRGNRAPLVPFNDDVSSFEADAGGGWVTARASSELRESISALRRGAENLRTAVTDRSRMDEIDTMRSTGIRRALRNDPNDPASLEDVEDLRKFRQALSLSVQVPRGMSPKAMLTLTRGAVRGFDAHSTDKAVAPTSYAPFGEAQMLMDAFGFLPNNEQLQEALTAHSISSLTTDAGNLVRTSGTAMDATGRTIEWASFDATNDASVEEMLDLIDDWESKPLAMMMLTPKALDVINGRLTERLMFESSLTSLLDNTGFKELFPTNEDDKLSLSKDMEYLMVLDSRARMAGGNFSAIRLANDLAITLQSSLDRPATFDDEQRFTAMAYHSIARVMRLVGQVLYNVDTRDAGLLDQIRDNAVETMRTFRVDRALPSFATVDRKITRDWIDAVLAQLGAEQADLIAGLNDQFEGDELERRIAAVDQQYAVNAEQIEAIFDDNIAQQLVSRFHITGDETVDAAARTQIVEYVRSMSDFPKRAPEAATAWSKLMQQLGSGVIDLKDEEWSVLSQGAMGVQLADRVLGVASHITIPPFPQGDPLESSSQYFKYFDQDYTWVAQDLLASTGPLAEAAVWMHGMGEQDDLIVKLDEASTVLNQTILRPQNYGRWSPGLMSQLVATQERMDSSAGGSGVAATGNGPKRWALPAFATRRTGNTAGLDALLTTAQLPGTLFLEDVDPFTEIPVTPAGGTALSTMPLAQLNNRFFSAVRVEGQPISLNISNMGFEWNEGDSPLRYLTVERLKPVLQRKARQLGIALQDLQIEVDFIHPDSQPAEGYYHNAYFEGMNHGLLPDGSESLIASYWSDNGGKIAEGTQALLDAGKKGQPAKRPFQAPNAGRLLDAANAWLVDNDFAKMLRIKTELWITTSQGDGDVSEVAYNAIYKMLKLQHIVIGTVNGERVALTAEQVIADQLANPDAPLGVIRGGERVEVENPELKTLSMDVLRSMLGETGTQGVPRYFGEDYLVNPDLVPEFTGITDLMLERFGDGWFADTGRIQDTTLAHVGHQRVLGVQTVVTKQERDSRREAVLRRDRRKQEVVGRRIKLNHMRDSWKKGLADTLRFAQDELVTGRADYNFNIMGIDAIAPKSMAELEHSSRILESFNQATAVEANRRGFQVVDEGKSDYAGGRITLDGLTDPKRGGADEIVADDIVVVQLGTFEDPTRDPVTIDGRIQSALDYLANTDATIVLAPSQGRVNRRGDAARYLRSRGYVPLQNSKHIYVPAVTAVQTQNERAYESTFLETQLITPNKNIVTLVAIDPIETDENAAAVNPRSSKLVDRKLVSNLLPPSYVDFNIPIDDNLDYGLYARVLDQLRTMLDPANTEARAALLKMGGQDLPRTKSLAQALDDFHGKITSRASIRPQAGDRIEKGDIIPFVHADGRVVLYRHGLKAPKSSQLTKLFAENNGMNIALAQSEAEAAATDNAGVITEVLNETGYGRRLQIETPLQTYGDKVQLEWNGMKYVLAPIPSNLQDHPMRIFGNGLEADLWSDLLSADSKEAFLGRVTSYRDALTFFQFDFLDDLTEFFFPGSKQGMEGHEKNRIATYNLLDQLTKQDGARIPYSTARAIARANVAIGDMLGQFAAKLETTEGVKADWTDRLRTADTANAQIARAMITYLLTPLAHVDNVLKSSGFAGDNALNDSGKARQVPGLFADLLSSNGYDSPLHEEMIRRWDAQLYRAADGSGMRLHKNWEVEVFGRPDANGDRSPVRVYLQYGEAHSSGDNPVLDGQAYDVNEPGSVSAHNAFAAAMSQGALTVHKALDKTKEFTKSFTRDGSVAKFSDPEQNLWEMLTRIPVKDASKLGWRQETAAESSRRLYARDEIAGLFTKLNTDDWTDEAKLKYKGFVNDVFGALHLYGVQRGMFDTWVRQYLGRPHGLDDDGQELAASIVSAKDALMAAQEILISVRNGDLPTAGARIPLIDNNHLAAIYMANANRAKGWAPRQGTSTNSPVASSWNDWVEVAFGTAWGEERNPLFDSVYLLSVDGLMHGYQGATSSTRILPVSTDVLKNNQLMDPNTSRMLISISADVNQQAQEVVVFNSTRATLEGIIVGERIYDTVRGANDPNGAQGRQDKRLKRWREEDKTPTPHQKRMRGVRGSGQSFLGHSTTTSAMWRSLINLRVGNAMFNVALLVSAPIEAFYRRTINTLANAAVGESTGAAGQLQVRLTERFKDTRIGKIAEELGWQPIYSEEQLKQINQLVGAIATRSDFKAMVYRELMYQYPSMPGIGRVEKALEKYAKFGGRIQDPAWGMIPKDLARIYVETIMRRMAADPTGENIYSVDTLLVNMQRNPEWIMQQDLETHNMAINAIANIRSLKASVVSLGMRGIIEPMSESARGFAMNSTGNFLRMMTVFQNFWSNYAINLTGMQGPADFVASLIDGREKKLGRRIQAAIRGDDQNQDEKEYYDMSEVLEGLDLADSFIRGGITHTALFTFGMMAGGLGLSGEDDEEKWRRRAAELQGAGVVHDPRKLQNDSSMRDAIYLDWLPMGLDKLFRIPDEQGGYRSVGQMNWLLRSVLSPIIGFERFYETGDFMEVLHGFKDAVGAHPIVNEQIWAAATQTVAELQNQASNEAAKGTDEGAAAASHLLTTAVGVLDRMLIENSMINMIYIGTDRYDRDPYALDKIDATDNQEVDVRGNPTETNALREFVNEDGETQQSYVPRDPFGAQVRTLTENRFGLALLGSIFTGISGGGFTGSDMFRQNMVVKTRQFELTPTAEKDIEATLLAAFRGAGNQPNLSESEIASQLRKQAKDAGVFYDNTEIEAQAAQLFKQQGEAPMSFIDPNGNETPTIDGGIATMKALANGSIDFESPTLNGFYLTQPMREELRDKWMEQLVNEGLELGLDKITATSRMKRLWFGPQPNPEDLPGLFDIVFSDKIPYTAKLEYNQLNTTYMIGPDGFPRATPFTRDGIFGALGLKPINRPWNEKDTGLDLDSRANTVDGPAGINTGMRALERRGEGWEVPTNIDEIRAASEKIADAIGEAAKGQDDGTGFRSGGYGGGYGYGGGGGGSYTPHINFVRMQPLSLMRATYGHEIQFINTSNPIIRRAIVRRERISSERLRLKQWQ